MATQHLSANDLERSWTSCSLPAVRQTLARTLTGRRHRTLLDVGCGYGGVAATLRDDLGIREAYGIDIDPRVVEEATAKGVRATCADIADQGLPYDDDQFDVVTCFGMLDYLPWFDTAIAEMSRVLVPSGVIAVVLPNLASWHNRLALLLGYQPRDVEFCSIRAVGLAPFYSSTTPVGHLHTPTTRAFREFMDLMGFSELATVALRRRQVAPALMAAADWALTRIPSLSRRFLYVGARIGDPAPPDGKSWWAPAR